MTDPSTSRGRASSALSEEQAIRERVRDLTTQMLAGGRLDAEGVKEVVRVMSGGGMFKPPLDNEQAREAFAAAVGAFAQALETSAQAANESLQALAARGKEFSDNDLKNAFAALQRLQEAYVAAANHIAEATTGNIRRELVDLTLHAQRVGADASVRIAQMMSEFASRMSGAYRGQAVPRIDAVREYSANMTMLTSGLLAGFADALRQQSESKKKR